MNNHIKLLSLVGAISLTASLAACCGPGGGPNWDTPLDFSCHPCYGGHYDYQRAAADRYNRMQEKKVVQGLGGVMYQPMN